MDWCFRPLPGFLSSQCDTLWDACFTEAAFPSPSGVSIFSIITPEQLVQIALMVSVPFRGFYLLNDMTGNLMSGTNTTFPSPSGVSIFSINLNDFIAKIADEVSVPFRGFYLLNHALYGR